ncbi:hypothetical protein [Arthrobacter sp. NPDC093139]|uniref:hypothetical protein n=1 Tax=Arthrobacter sp. NPDC093139 TaxID=3363945 RepID=UPI0037FC4242
MTGSGREGFWTSHEGANSSGQFCFTLTVTDIATGWTVNRSVPNKAQKHVFASLQQVISAFPFPVIGIDSDNGGESISIFSTSARSNGSLTPAHVPATRATAHTTNHKTGPGSAIRSER